MLVNLLPPETYCKFGLPYLGLALIDLSLSRGESAQDDLLRHMQGLCELVYQ